jgi:ABC-type transporter Mla maintaining outer membrane lipid asymmetry ATPase subunit MlaF/ABC-type transporter Mla maintaining outer membrane lipid asymmetry permease subunit MlaE
VELSELTVRAGERVLLENASARFEPGTVTLIVGPSGVGKSVLLRILAGLIGRSQGEIEVSGSVTFGGREVLAARGPRMAGVVFQNFALFDELSPTDNVRFARAHRVRRYDGDGKEIATPTPAELLDELQVPRSVRTATLSGGQRQRLAIARTLAYNPDVILYDEPTSGLDLATARQVASLIGKTHHSHPKTSIIVTHDYAALTPIADAVYLLDPISRTLRQIPREHWDNLGEWLHAPPVEKPDDAPAWQAWLRDGAVAAGRWPANFLAGTTHVLEAVAQVPLRLLPLWRSPFWGLRYLLHYLRLVAGVSAWVYIAVAGTIIGYVLTHFTLEYFPHAKHIKPVLLDDILRALGFMLYRVFVPVLATILIAARCGAAVASDVGGKTYGQQMDALRTFRVSPSSYLLTGILYAFVIGAPLLVGLSFLMAKYTSLIAFMLVHEQGPDYWYLNFHRELIEPGRWLYVGTDWLLAKVLCCAVGVAVIAYFRGARPKYSNRDVSTGITTTILWATLYTLVVHFAFAFVEFDQVPLWDWLAGRN